jgi:BirA family biotin operon repressor/biotin-[acetyl-CoA-carboxylase] ligase
VAETAPGLAPRLSLKWPNDLLCDDAKLAGILIEGEGGHPLAVVIGIGVNCACHPADTAYPATDLAAAGATVTPEGLFRALSRTMPARLAQWDRGAAFASVRRDWLMRARGIGAEIRVARPEREVVGVFHALDDAGRLVLRLPDGRTETVTAADVFPVAPPPAIAGAR